MKDAEEKTPNAVFECKNCDFVDEVYVPADQIKDEYETQMLGAQKTTKSVSTGESTSVKATAPTVGSISSSGTATKLVSTGDNTSGMAVAALLLAAGAAGVLGVASRKRC